MRNLVLALGVILCGGCLDSPSSDDMSAEIDMTRNFDLLGADLVGLYNCSQLNDCEKKCRNLMCVSQCRQMSTPSAVTKEVALQNCFNNYCPQTQMASDMAMPAVCGRDIDGNLVNETACNTCINNTLQPATTSCNPTTAPECTKCYNQAADCAAD